MALTLVQAVLKGEKMDDIVRDAVMLGVAAVQPIVTARAETTVAALARGARPDRWRRVALASVKQSGRAVLPEIRRPLTLESLLAEPQPALTLMLVEPGAGVVAEPISALRGQPVPQDAAILVGPEGGWTAEECAEARDTAHASSRSAGVRSGPTQRPSPRSACCSSSGATCRHPRIAVCQPFGTIRHNSGPRSRERRDSGTRGGFDAHLPSPDTRRRHRAAVRALFVTAPVRCRRATEVVSRGGGEPRRRQFARAAMRAIKRRMIGMAGGTLWLIAVSTAFAILSLVWIGTPLAGAVLVVVVGLVTLLLVLNIRALRAAVGIPDDLPPRTAKGRAMMRSFGLITAAEVVGILVVNALCGFYRQNALMAPLDLIIVGLHFVALARLFEVPRYTVMGWLFCAVPIVTMLALPEWAQVGHAPALVRHPRSSVSVGRLADGRRKSARNLPIGPVEDVRTRGSDSK